MVAIHLGSKRRPLSLKCCCNNCWVPHLSHSPLSFFSLSLTSAHHICWLLPSLSLSIPTHECTHLHSGGRVFRIGDGSQPHEASEGGSQRPDPAHRRRRGEGSRTGGGAAQAPREVALRRWRRRRSRAVLCGGGGRAQHAAAAARPRWTCRDAARKPAGDRFAAGPTFSLTTPNNGYCTSSFNLHFLLQDNLYSFFFLVHS